ncbi:MAG: sigma-70 family RNA polymerase sigma factor [Bacteroidales bacterium]|nr:MAG: sigma-70 family RNA polymerase sigma factor [Bacteroidales bacterium]
MSQSKVIIENQDFNDLILKLKEHDERAWSQLNFVIKRIVLKWLSNKKLRPEHAYEIYSNTIAVLFEKFRELQFSSFSGLKSYVFSIAENKVKEFYRNDLRSKMQDRLDDVPELCYVLYMTEADGEVASEVVNKIHNLFNKLSKSEKDVMQLLYNEERTNKEASELLGINEGNLRIIKFRALQKLKEWYSHGN